MSDNQYTIPVQTIKRSVLQKVIEQNIRDNRAMLTGSDVGNLRLVGKTATKFLAGACNAEGMQITERENVPPEHANICCPAVQAGFERNQAGIWGIGFDGRLGKVVGAGGVLAVWLVEEDEDS